MGQGDNACRVHQVHKGVGNNVPLRFHSTIIESWAKKAHNNALSTL
ncbi:hypothetical protein HMPREF0476_0326 [Kingella kingae ATCC 23330]|uniref:Uncharacterized protein n=1 Tax=Kingella kingae ATCC 23330 TaxID=887327 RepID=F5S543_KINKI|nr:hypothetical protein HMPREF0476_0326 [Kingella kingae ATCC 23330]